MRWKSLFRPILFLTLFVLFLSGCAAAPAEADAPAAFARYTRYASDIFDTEITLIGYTQSAEDFDRIADKAMDQLRAYNRIFDNYNAYGELHNLWYINRHAAEGPVEIPGELFYLLSWCEEKWQSGYTDANIAMGAVLSIWHDYRTAGILDPQRAALPPMEDLRAAQAHTDFSDVVLDAEKQTVFYADPLLQIDVGAVAKGYAADLICAYLQSEMPSFLLSLGGNVYAGEPPLDGRAAWAVAVQDPRADLEALLSGGTDRLDILDISSLTAVTSGDYWRYYVVDGQRYHHIIDPKTLMPSTEMLSVTVVCESSLLADYLSTTLFILSLDEGEKLVESLDGVEVMWVLPDGTIHSTPGMARYARSMR